MQWSGVVSRVLGVREEVLDFRILGAWRVDIIQEGLCERLLWIWMGYVIDCLGVVVLGVLSFAVALDFSGVGVLEFCGLSGWELAYCEICV